MRVLSAAVLALAVLLAACGGDPPTEQEWRVAARTLCVNGEMETMKTRLPGSRPETDAFDERRVAAAEEVEPACSGAVREIQAEREKPAENGARQVADELRVLAKSLSSNVPPQEATPPWEAVTKELATTADLLDQGEAAADRLDASIFRGAGAFTLLNVDGCDDVYAVVAGGEPS